MSAPRIVDLSQFDLRLNDSNNAPPNHAADDDTIISMDPSATAPSKKGKKNDPSRKKQKKKLQTVAETAQNDVQEEMQALKDMMQGMQGMQGMQDIQDMMQDVQGMQALEDMMQNVQGMQALEDMMQGVPDVQAMGTEAASADIVQVNTEKKEVAIVEEVAVDAAEHPDSSAVFTFVEENKFESLKAKLEHIVSKLMKPHWKSTFDKSHSWFCFSKKRSMEDDVYIMIFGCLRESKKEGMDSATSASPKKDAYYYFKLRVNMDFTYDPHIKLKPVKMDVIELKSCKKNASYIMLG